MFHSLSLLSVFYSFVLVLAIYYNDMISEQKREIYDMYGKEGMQRAAAAEDDFATPGHFHFHFRSPEEIFRDFFGTDDPFARIFGGEERIYSVFFSVCML